MGKDGLFIRYMRVVMIQFVACFGKTIKMSERPLRKLLVSIA